MLSKKDMIERLRKHPLYKAAIASVDKETAARISSMTEGFLLKAFDGLAPALEKAKNDPSAFSVPVEEEQKNK